MAAFQDEKIRRYLMDELSEQEREEFEQRLFADDELFREVQTAEMALIDRFVRSAMSPAEQRLMEREFLVTPERRARVAEARIFHQELEELRQPAVLKVKVSWWTKLFSGWNVSLPQIQYAAAALVIVLTAAVAWLVYDRNQTQRELTLARAEADTRIREQIAAKEKELNQRLEQQQTDEAETLSALQQEIEQLQQQLAEAKRQQPQLAKTLRPPDSERPSVIETIPFKSLTAAGAGMPIIITVEEGTKVVNLQIPVDELDRNSFKVTITKGTEVVLVVEDVKARRIGGTNNVSISVPANSLEEGHYEVSVQNERGETRKRTFVIQ